EIAQSIHSFPYLIQEFIDTSAGVPGIVEGIHDFRIVAVSGEPVVCYVRTPPPGKKLANVAQGGKEIHVTLDRIPQEALALFQQVDDALARFPKRVYSVDMGRNVDGRWMIIELNSKPGLTPKHWGPDNVRFMELLADTLLS